MLLILINVLVIIVVGAILFYLIDRFVRDGRLANLLKILVVLISLPQSCSDSYQYWVSGFRKAKPQKYSRRAKGMPMRAVLRPTPSVARGPARDTRAWN